MINGKYHTERKYNGKQIVIDVAEICGRYEIAVLTKNGTELEMETVRTIQEAREIYSEYLKKYPESPAPLTGKYKQLAEDIREAVKAGQEAEVGVIDRYGSSNIDSVIIYLPRWNREKIRQAAKEAGVNVVVSGYSSRGILLDPVTSGQGQRRTVNVRAMKKLLENAGYNVSIYYCMD